LGIRYSIGNPDIGNLKTKIMTGKISILGAGESGIGAALLATSKGYDVFVSDNGRIDDQYINELENSDIAYEQNGHTEEKVLSAGILVKSPGIPDTSPIIQRAKVEDVEIISEIEFAYRNTKAKIIGITGTNGKTTTTQLTYHLLNTGGFNVGVAGNIGTSMARMVIADSFDWLVVELSSFQLDDIVHFHPSIAIVLNITPDHLNRYDDFEHYAKAKFKLLKNMEQEDYVVYWIEDNVIARYLQMQNEPCQKEPVSLIDHSISYYTDQDHLFLNGLNIETDNLPIKGDHNYINMMCASAAAQQAGVPDAAVREGLQTFIGIPHRMEYIDKINGISFVNDSKATNVEAVYYALGTFSGPITWIAGGEDKGNDYLKIIPLVEEKVNAIICLGADNEKLLDTFRGIPENIIETTDIKEAARMALEYSNANDVVLLSPACASFDLFKNYEDRGDQFREAVANLKIIENKKLSQS